MTYTTTHNTYIIHRRKCMPASFTTEQFKCTQNTPTCVLTRAFINASKPEQSNADRRFYLSKFTLLTKPVVNHKMSMLNYKHHS